MVSNSHILSHWKTKLGNFLLVLCFSSVLIWSNGVGVGAALLLLISPAFAFRQAAPAWLGYERILLGALAFYFFSAVLSFALEAQDQQKLSDLDIPGRALVIIGVWWGLRRVPLSTKAWWIAIWAGVLGAVCFGAYERWIEHQYLAKGGTNHHILFGSLSMALGVMCLTIPKNLLKGSEGIRWLGFSCGIVASLFSTSRAAWIIPFIALPIWLYFLPLQFSLRKGCIAIAVAGAALLISISLPNIGVTDRIHVAIDDVQSYFKTGDNTSSLGARIEMWRGSIHLIKQAPIMGGGLESYQSGINQLQQDKVIQPIRHLNQHPHNDFLNAATNRGLIVGGLSLLAIYCIPLLMFWRCSRSTEPAAAGAAQAGVLFILSYIICGLTESLFDRSLSTTFYFLTIITLYTFIRQNENSLAMDVLTDTDEIPNAK